MYIMRPKSKHVIYLLGKKVLVLRTARSLNLEIRGAQPVYIYTLISRDSPGETHYFFFLHVEKTICLQFCTSFSSQIAVGDEGILSKT